MYEYVCGGCGHHVEVLQKISDLPLLHCDNCQKDALERVVSRSGFRLKGEGWYETDFKGGDNKRNLVDAPEPSSPAASDTSVSTKTEAKPAKETAAAKPETKTD
jgi:putative FmdB family regulatory protein